MVIKKLVSYALALLIVLGCCSCSSSSQIDKTGTSTKSTTDGKNKPTITVQYFVGRADIQRALTTFQSNNPEVTVKSEFYEFDIKTVNAFSNKLLLDLNTGEGPDVMIYDDFLFKSLYKAAGSGVFYDLNKMFEAVCWKRHLQFEYHIHKAPV
jgi:ABC-type glycerol-3-phosphate transport system substrate-binding protein